MQAYLAGDAALIAPEAWPRHVAWIHAFLFELLISIGREWRHAPRRSALA